MAEVLDRQSVARLALASERGLLGHRIQEACDVPDDADDLPASAMDVAVDLVTRHVLAVRSYEAVAVVPPGALVLRQPPAETVGEEEVLPTIGSLGEQLRPARVGDLANRSVWSISWRTGNTVFAPDIWRSGRPPSSCPVGRIRDRGGGGG
jgi:hypothetical protein